MISAYTIRLRWLLRNGHKTAFDSQFAGFVLLGIVRVSGRVARTYCMDTADVMLTWMM